MTTAPAAPSLYTHNAYTSKRKVVSRQSATYANLGVNAMTYFVNTQSRHRREIDFVRRFPVLPFIRFLPISGNLHE